MWKDRAYRVRRDIAAPAAAGLGVSELHAAAIRLIADEVSTELTCWAAIDPETLVISTMVSGETRIPPEYEPRLAEAEYSADEPHRFATLALRKVPVAKLADLPDRERERSARLNNVWRPLGLDRGRSPGQPADRRGRRPNRGRHRASNRRSADRPAARGVRFDVSRARHLS